MFSREPMQARIYKMIEAYHYRTKRMPTTLVAGPEYALLIDKETRGEAIVVCGLHIQRVRDNVFLVMEGKWTEL
jgi:hypothetical protein